jgi:flagellar hook assembly protein FlgD
VRVAIFDAQGRVVATPASGAFVAGRVELPWDGRDAAGHGVHSGMYYVRVETPSASGAIPALVLR